MYCLSVGYVGYYLRLL